MKQFIKTVIFLIFAAIAGVFIVGAILYSDKLNYWQALVVGFGALFFGIIAFLIYQKWGKDI